MPRQLRWNTSHSFHHVMNRGSSRGVIFHNPKDYRIFLNLIKLLKDDYNFELLSYCLMSNHYHLLIRTPDANLSDGMRHLGSMYTKQYNQKYKKDGALFRGRFHSILVEGEEYLSAVISYIHQNPVKAGLCFEDKDYRWSSARQTEMNEVNEYDETVVDSLSLNSALYKHKPSWSELVLRYECVVNSRESWFSSDQDRTRRLRLT